MGGVSFSMDLEYKRGQNLCVLWKSFYFTSTKIFFFFIFVVYDGVSCALLLLLRYGRINEKVYLAKVLWPFLFTLSINLLRSWKIFSLWRCFRCCLHFFFVWFIPTQELEYFTLFDEMLSIIIGVFFFLNFFSLQLKFNVWKFFFNIHHSETPLSLSLSMLSST